MLASLSCRTCIIAGLVSVNLAQSGVQQMPETVTFEFLRPMSLSAVSPSTGLHSGGKQVKIHGEGFRAAKYVLIEFCGDTVLAKTLDDATMVLTTPTMATGICRVQLAREQVTGRIDSNETPLRFEVMGGAYVASLQPSWALLSGNEMIRVQGEGFHGPVRCCFGKSRQVTATEVSSTEVVCKSPGVKRAAVVPFKLAVGGGPCNLEGGDFMLITQQKLKSLVEWMKDQQGKLEIFPAAASSNTEEARHGGAQAFADPGMKAKPVEGGAEVPEDFPVRVHVSPVSSPAEGSWKWLSAMLTIGRLRVGVEYDIYRFSMPKAPKGGLFAKGQLPKWRSAVIEHAQKEFVLSFKAESETANHKDQKLFKSTTMVYWRCFEK